MFSAKVKQTNSRTKRGVAILSFRKVYTFPTIRHRNKESLGYESRRENAFPDFPQNIKDNSSRKTEEANACSYVLPPSPFISTTILLGYDAV
jgi:hypothetical protein